MPDITRQLPPQTARAMFQPETFNAANNTIEVVFATETPVLRSVWGERFFEVLVCEPASIRMDRINQAGPVVDTHGTWSLADQFGVVERAWIDTARRECRALIRLSTTEGDKEIVEKIKTGIIRNVSVQYRIYAYEMIEAPENETPTMRVTDWEPMEISFVPMPADHNAGVRSYSHDFNEVIIKKANKSTMSENKNGAGAGNETRTETTPAVTGSAPTTTAGAAPAAQDSVEQARSQGAAEGSAAERTRIKDIKAACRAAKLDDAFTEKLIDDGTPIDKARQLIIDELARTETALPAVQGALRVNRDETDKRRIAIIDSLCLRSARIPVDKFKPEAISAAREFRSMSLLDIAKDCLTRAGIDFRDMDKMDIVGRAFTSSSSDFPVLLEGTTRRILLNAYSIQADTWRRWCAVGSVPDFRQSHRLRLGSFSRLDKVKENGEFKNKEITDAEKESVSAESWGNIVNLTRVMIVNDDLAGFTRIASNLGRAASRSVEIDVYKLLAENPVLSDGKALFHADHKNLIASGSAMSVESFDQMRVTMAKQMDKDGNEYLDLRPEILLCSVANGGNARVINKAEVDPDTPNKLQRPNKSAGLFKDIVDTPRIEGNEYYAFADPNEEPVIEVNFLEGNQTPRLESQKGFTVDGVQWKVGLDYGVDAIGYRGAVKNPGA